VVLGQSVPQPEIGCHRTAPKHFRGAERSQRSLYTEPPPIHGACRHDPGEEPPYLTRLAVRSGARSILGIMLLPESGERTPRCDQLATSTQ
jgi:hypothetical protein